MNHRPIRPNEDARAQVQSRKGADGFVRTAIKLTADRPASLDIVDSTGALVARVNLFQHESGARTVDVIPSPETTGKRREVVLNAWTDAQRIGHLLVEDPTPLPQRIAGAGEKVVLSVMIQPER